MRHLERRLFRGLASGRKAARLGYSVVITEILVQLFGETTEKKAKYAAVTLDRLLDILSAKTKPEGDLSGQEERDHYLGVSEDDIRNRCWETYTNCTMTNGYIASFRFTDIR